jgi:hypothetical protein
MPIRIPDFVPGLAQGKGGMTEILDLLAALVQFSSQISNLGAQAKDA